MSEELKHKIYSATECISEQKMFDYIDNKLNAKEQHLVEKHLLDCDLCSDALEGLRLLKNRNQITTINQKISERLIAIPKQESKIVFFNFKTITSIAAAIALLIGGVFLFNQFAQQKMKENDVAELKKESTPPPAVTINNTEPVPASDTKKLKQPETITTSTNKLQFETQEKSQQQFALAEEQKTDSYYKNPAASGEGTTINNSVTTGDVVTKSDKNSETIVPVESTIPKAGLLEKEKDIFALDETKKAEEKHENENVTFLAKQNAPVQKNNADNFDLDKKTSKNNRFRSDTKGKDKAAKQVATDDISGNVGTTQQNAISDQENLKTEQPRAETTTTSITDSTITIVDEMPEFPGGEAEMLKFIQKNFKYSKFEKGKSIPDTKIYVQFVISKTGNVKNAKIIKGINPEYDKEALRVINILPEWKPAKLKGQAVEYKFNLPIQLEFK